MASPGSARHEDGAGSAPAYQTSTQKSRLGGSRGINPVICAGTAAVCPPRPVPARVRPHSADCPVHTSSGNVAGAGPWGGRASRSEASLRLVFPPACPGSGLAELFEDADNVAGSTRGAGLGGVVEQHRPHALGVMEEFPCEHRLHLRRHRTDGERARVRVPPDRGGPGSQLGATASASTGAYSRGP